MREGYLKLQIPYYQNLRNYPCPADPTLRRLQTTLVASLLTSIHSKLGNTVNSRVSTQDTDNNLVHNSFTSCFKSLSVDDVRHIIMQSSKKSCSLDPVPMSLVVECTDVLLPVITLIINPSLQSGHFPEVWKEAIVTTLLKKCGSDPSNFKNLHPVSNLSYISKLTESAVAVQIQLHLDKNNLYLVFQSAYRKLHSTETAFVKVHNDILTNMNKRLMTLLDLSAAFDTVDPSNLFKIKAGSQWNCCFVALLLSNWKDTTNICSRNAFNCISSSL